MPGEEPLADAPWPNKEVGTCQPPTGKYLRKSVDYVVLSVENHGNIRHQGESEQGANRAFQPSHDLIACCLYTSIRDIPSTTTSLGTRSSQSVGIGRNVTTRRICGCYFGP